MTLTDDWSGAAATTPGSGRDEAAQAVATAIERERVREVEVMWLDHQGHARGKRIDAASFLDRARGPVT